MNRELFQDLIDNQIYLLKKVKADLKLQEDIHNAADIIVASLKNNLPLLVMGNGGSAADAMHITGELLGRFVYERKPLNAICLNSEISAITAISNDDDYGQIFSRQVKAHAAPNGVLLGISTSGNSLNIVNAFKEAKKQNMNTIALTGLGGGKLKKVSDIVLESPSDDTPRIQELHIIIYHYICLLIDLEFREN